MSAEDMTPEERIDRYLLGQATPADVEVLNQLLLQDERLRKLYRYRVALEGGYREAAIRGESGEPLLVAPSPKPNESSAARSKLLYGVVVAVASLAAVVLYVVVPWTGTDVESTAPGDFAVQSNAVARLVASIDAEWSDIEPLPGSMLQTGSFRLIAGTVDLEFDRGARVTLQGPSSFELMNADLLHLASGNLIARIPEEAIGFTITTDQAEVIDLGTEFGLAVKNDGHTDVHVLDGLVEVLPRRSDDSVAGVMIAEGQARRFDVQHDVSPAEIPVSSRDALIGSRRYRNLGVRMLRGAVRMTDQLGAVDYTAKSDVRHWIDLIAEAQNVTLSAPLDVSLDSPGRYRKFGTSDKAVPAGVRVNSYLLHFRPSSRKGVRGVIRFEQPIVGVLCTPRQLEASDSIFGLSTIEYPEDPAPRGLEPGPYFDTYVARSGMPADFQPDEVILSQDRATLSIRASADPDNGYYDQVRILTLAPD